MGHDDQGIIYVLLLWSSCILTHCVTCILIDIKNVYMHVCLTVFSLGRGNHVCDSNSRICCCGVDHLRHQKVHFKVSNYVVNTCEYVTNIM